MVAMQSKSILRSSRSATLHGATSPLRALVGAIVLALASFAMAADGPPSPLQGKPLRYLIGARSFVDGTPDEITEVGFRAERPPRYGIAVKYGNLFDEGNSGQYGPYMAPSDTAEDYNEGQIDYRGPGWWSNIDEQLMRAKAQGFKIIEWDNADAYPVEAVIGAADRAAEYGLQVIAKNPHLIKGGEAYVARPNVVGIVVERDTDSTPTPSMLHALRVRAGRPTLPVWFVGFGEDVAWVNAIAAEAQQHRMGVTYSTEGEYRNSIDIVRP